MPNHLRRNIPGQGRSAVRNASAAAFFLFAGLVLAGTALPAAAQDKGGEKGGGEKGGGDLAAAAQNPIANMISVPLQNNTYFGVTEADDEANVLNIQPVIPLSLGEWNVITRTIVPFVYVPDPTDGIEHLPNHDKIGDAFGLGDINFSAFFSPAKPGKLIWGVGPTITVPSATDKRTGAEKWSAGPTAVALITPKPWVLGVLVNNIWSFAGKSQRGDVNQLTVQPFVNYNLPEGWYLTSSPVITADWEETGDERWTVPLGGGFGKIFHIGKQALNAQTQAFYYAEAPELGPDWALRLQLQFLFPK
jgi:hypothetical protein